MSAVEMERKENEERGSGSSLSSLVHLSLNPDAEIRPSRVKIAGGPTSYTIPILVLTTHVLMDTELLELIRWISSRRYLKPWRHYSLRPDSERQPRNRK